MSDHTIIALDLGATKCAAGIIEYSHQDNTYTCKNTCEVKLADTRSLLDLIDQIASLTGLSFSKADAVCIGAAGQYNGHELHHLDGVYPYPMPFAKLAEQQQWRKYAVIHDYDSIVCATFTSYMNDANNILRLNTCKPEPLGRRIAFGLGTGLGLKDGVLLANGHFWLGKNEIGHIGIIQPPLADTLHLKRHQEFMHFLLTRQSHSREQVSFESILTGRGLANLYQFLYPSAVDVTPEIAGEKMQSPQGEELLNIFSWYLGLFIGSVELIFMPEGGIWITGGVVIKHMEIFDQPSFTAGIEASPAYREERQRYALGVMKNPEHALIGAGYYAVQRLLPAKTRSICLS